MLAVKLTDEERRCEVRSLYEELINLLKQNKTKEALSKGERFLASRADLPAQDIRHMGFIYMLLGDIRLGLGEFDLAEQNFRKIMILAEEQEHNCVVTMASLRSVEVLIEMCRFEEAGVAFRGTGETDFDNCQYQEGFCKAHRQFVKAKLLGRSGDNTGAIKILESMASKVFTVSQDSMWLYQVEVLTAGIYLELGRRYAATGQRKQAKESFNQAYALGDQAGLLFIKAQSALFLCRLYIFENQLDLAKSYLAQSHSIYDGLGSKLGLAFCNESRAEILSHEGTQLESSRNFYVEALKTFDDLQFWKAKAQVCSKMAHLYLKQGRFDEAIKWYEEDNILCSQHQLNPIYLGFSHRHLSRAYRSKSDIPMALHHIDESIRIFKEKVSNPFQQALSYLEKTFILIDSGSDIEAEESLNKTASLFSDKIQEEYSASLEHLKGCIFRLRGEREIGRRNILWAKAEEAFKKSLKSRRKKLDIKWTETYFEYGLLLHKRGNKAKAESIFGETVNSALLLGHGGLNVRLLREIRKIDQVFSQFIERAFTSALFNVEEVVTAFFNPTSLKKFQPRRRKATIMFADIRNFVGITGDLPDEETINMLNGFMDHIVYAVKCNEGKVDKFIGDAVMAIFGIEGNPAKDLGLTNAINAAIDAQNYINDFNSARILRNQTQIFVKFTINSGGVLWGIFGTNQRRDFTCIGEVINIASRLGGVNFQNSHLDEPNRNIILAACETPETRKVLERYETEDLGEFSVKGVKRKIPIVYVSGHSSSGS